MTIWFERPSPALIVAGFALLVALGPAVKAANTVGSSDIIDFSIQDVDIKDGAITNPKLAVNSVGSGNVINKSLTADDLKGANVRGSQLSLAAGAVPNGRCRYVFLAAPGAVAGDAVIISLMGPAPAGMHFSGARSVANQVILQVCNLTGTASPVITSLPLRIVTIG